MSIRGNGRGGEVVVITGASAGVGRATAREFARRGAKIGLLARGREGLEAARREVEHLGGEALVVPTDVAEQNQVDAAAEAVEYRFGPIDIWINNAMVSVFSPVKKMKPEEYKRVTDVTYLGSVYGTLAALQRMLPRDQGHIIQVGSALAYRSIPLQSAYCAAKAALRGFTDSLRVELLHEKSHIRLTAVHLPAINTPQFNWTKTRMPRKSQPVPPIYQPEVAARAIVWAADHNRRELWVGWPTMQAILGNKVAPGLLDRKLAETGIEGQLYNGPVDPDRPNNLWEPVEGDFGAHGDFDHRSREYSPQFWATTNREKLGLAAAGLVGAALAGFFSFRRRK
jgi:NAD(P)-dependent dehydrogenase (short-subunit alcohol dehydrogenase family)